MTIELNFRLMAFMLLITMTKPCLSQSPARVRQNIDFNWRFHLGDVANGEQENINDNDWRILALPHDFSIEGNYDKKNFGGRENGFLPAGIGWYRKTIDWNKNWQNKIISIEFDGVFMNSDVWINGKLLGHRPYGYIGFSYNLTPYLKSGKNNIAVRVDNEKVPSSRWYTGSGIYRHVWLDITNKTRVAHWGTHVYTSDESTSAARVHVNAKVVGGVGEQMAVISVIQNNKGKALVTQIKKIKLDQDTTSISQHINFPHPLLWSSDHPAVYYLKTIIKQKNKIQDEYVTRFGVRKAEFSSEFGFKLNGEKIKFKGMCIHQDVSPMGTAVPEDIWHSRIVQLKEMGCNALRTAHHPFPPEFYALCDTLGMMVMDEIFDGWNFPKVKWDYSNYYNDWWKKDVTDFVLRDRNAPSVMMWSMGNEVWGYEKELPVQKGIYDVMHSLDSVRPVTQAWALGTYLDIAGFNANGEKIGDLEKFHKAQPNMPAIGTEIPHTRQTRGVYRTQTSYFPWCDSVNEKGVPYKYNPKRNFYIPNLSANEVFPEFDLKYASGYDNQTREISVREQWKHTRDNNFFMGEFRWAGCDYLGESWGWPARTNNFGIIDLAGFAKDHYYLYQSLWTSKPMVHIAPHWTWPGKEGVIIPVVAYTNCDEAELFLNGKSLGRQIMSKDTLQMVWQVPYQPGKLEVVSYKNKKPAAKETCVTARAAYQINLFADKKTLHANRREVTQITLNILDVNRHFNPTANDTIYFEVTGPYKLLGVENGDIIDLSPNKVLWRKTFMGKALLVLQATEKAGIIKVAAKAKGLKQDSITINVIK